MSPYLALPLRSEAQYRDLLYGRDGQPDILFLGDRMARARHEALCTADFLFGNIKIEQQATWNRRTDRTRVSEGLAWIRDARERRRECLSTARAYTGQIDLRDLGRVLGLAGE